VNVSHLLDTHTLLWAIYAPEMLSEKAREGITPGDHAIFVSAVSAYEISLKYKCGKLDFARDLAQHFSTQVAMMGFLVLDLSVSHAQAAGLLPLFHKDPFDRMLIAQAQIEGFRLISKEALFDQFGVARLW
jgi:PIN domain nuclease of toxin-antitoxin system